MISTEPDVYIKAALIALEPYADPKFGDEFFLKSAV